MSTTGIWDMFNSATSSAKSPFSMVIRSRYLVALKNWMPKREATVIKMMMMPMAIKPYFSGLPILTGLFLPLFLRNTNWPVVSSLTISTPRPEPSV